MVNDTADAGVRVTLSDDRETEPKQHPDAIGISVDSGHLHVLNEISSSIAIYAPGEWRYAKVISAKE
jgi:hypothetical protein